MTMITLLMVLLFILGYTLIAFEFKTQINKTAIAILLGVALWALYLYGATDLFLGEKPLAFKDFIELKELSGAPYFEQVRSFVVDFLLVNHLGDVASILIFLMGAMTIVEIIDSYGGFNFVHSWLTTRNTRKLLWTIMLMTFFLSSVLDNLTTAIVMIMVLRKLIGSQRDRWMFAGIVVVAANAGGAFSPIGDVTTILLWVHGNVSSLGILTVSFLPSFVSVAVPTLLVSFTVCGNLDASPSESESPHESYISQGERVLIFSLGVGGLISVPVFKAITGLPPVMGVMTVLAVLWTYTELLYRRRLIPEEESSHRVASLIKHIDMATVLFLFGILMSVAALQEAGILRDAARFLDEKVHNVYGVNVLIGFLSSVVDNSSLVAGVIGMYPIATSQTVAAAADPAYLSCFLADGEFWMLLAYCAGVGGSLTIIGSAAGVMVMGLEKISFDWYFKKFSWMVLAGYLAGVGVYYLQSLFRLA